MKKMIRKNTMEFREKLRYYGAVRISDPCEGDKVHNHIPSNGLLGNKKGMFYSLR